MAGEMDRPLPRGPLLDERLLRWFGAQYLPPGQDPGDPRLSPLRADLSGLCPTLVVTAGFDPLQPQGLAYAEALLAAGVTVQQVDHPTLAHGFADFAGVVPAARTALEDAARRLGAMFPV
jgi:acetyl esterase